MANAVLELIVGPMKSGKSHLMITELDRFRFAQKNYPFSIFKPAADLRDNELKSRTGLSLPSTQVKTIQEVYEECDKTQYHIVAIDEFHMFPSEGFEETVAKMLARSRDTRYIFSGLDRDYKGDLMDNFVSLLRLPYNKITTLNAICSECNIDDARDTIIKFENIPLNGGLDQVISEQAGSKLVFEPHCRTCFARAQKNAKSYNEISKEKTYSTE